MCYHVLSVTICTSWVLFRFDDDVSCVVQCQSYKYRILCFVQSRKNELFSLSPTFEMSLVRTSTESVCICQLLQKENS